MKKWRNAKSSRQQLEVLEQRCLLSSVAVSGGNLDLTGDVNQSNAFLVRAAPPGRVLGFANNYGECVSVSTVGTVIVYLGDETDTVTVTKGVTTPVEVISQSGQVTWMGAGTSQTFDGSAAGSSGSGSSSSSSSNGNTSGNGSGNSNSDPPSNSGSGSSNSNGSSSSGSSGSGSSGSGSSSSGSTSSGSSSSGSSGTGSSGNSSSGGSSGSGSSSGGSSSSGSSGSGSSNSGSSNSGSSSSGSSGSGSSGSGSSSNGSSGSGSSNNGSSGSGSSSSGSGSPTAPSDPSDPSAPQPVITFTTSSTVLPQESVNVNAISSSFGDGTILNSEIAWNFGDPGSAYNTLVGFNVAHAYANPGTYTITLTVTTPDGQVGVATSQVTVSPDTRPTIYVSPNGNDSNNGLSPSTAIQTIPRLDQLLTSNVRVLFQSGGTYSLSTTDINLNGLSHVYVGSYGSGAQPILMYTGVPQNGMFIGLSSSSQGIVIDGLTFDSIYANNDDKQAIPSGIVMQGNDIAVLNNTFLNVLDDMVAGEQASTNTLVQGNSSPEADDLSAYFYFVGGSDIVVVGNTVANSVGEAVFRVGGANDIEVADNNFTELPADGGTTGGKNILSIQEGTYAYVYNNTLNTGPVEVGPIGTAASNPTSFFKYAVFDSNTLINGSNFVIDPNASYVMDKNNVVVGAGTVGFTINAQEVVGSFNWQVQNVYIEDNTVTDPAGEWGGFLSIADGQAANVYVDNNLFVDPGFEIGEAAFIKVDEDNLNSFAQIQDNIWPVPTSMSSWAQGGYFFVSSNPSSQSGWLTPNEWEATGVPTGNVYQNVNLGATYSITLDGVTAGSSLPTS